MDLAFDDEKLRMICLKKARAVASFGPEVAHELIKRLADVRAAGTTSDLILRTSVSIRNGLEVLVVSLAAGFELVLAANHVENPNTASGKIDWARVTRVKVLEISRAILQ